MGGKAAKCRIYIIFHHALFAQGIRSLLRGRRTIQIVGMESDQGKAMEAVRSLRPEVIIVEESDAGVQSPSLEAILRRHPTGRVVALDLDHNYATVYDRHQVTTAQPADLINAIRGGRRDRRDVGPAGVPRSSGRRRLQAEGTSASARRKR